MNVQYCLKNKNKGIRWESFDDLQHCPNISTIGMLNYVRSIRSISTSAREIHANHFEIHYVERGIQMFRVGESIVPLHAGELFVALPGQIHGPLHGIVRPATIYWVRLSAKLSEGFSLSETRLITQHLEKISGQVCTENKPIIRPLMDSIMELLKSPPTDTERQLSLKNLSASLVASLLQATPRKNGTTRHAASIEKVCRIIKNINDEPEHAYHIPSMAKKCGICETLFRSLFKESCGYSPVDYIHFTRIEKAKKLLLQGISSTKIAYELGYSSPPHFCTVFSKWTGSAPSLYPKKMANRGNPIARSSDKPVYQKLQQRYGS